MSLSARGCSPDCSTPGVLYFIVIQGCNFVRIKELWEEPYFSPETICFSQEYIHIRKLVFLRQFKTTCCYENLIYIYQLLIDKIAYTPDPTAALEAAWLLRRWRQLQRSQQQVVEPWFSFWSRGTWSWWWRHRQGCPSWSCPRIAHRTDPGKYL